MTRANRGQRRALRNRWLLPQLVRFCRCPRGWGPSAARRHLGRPHDSALFVSGHAGSFSAMEHRAQGIVVCFEDLWRLPFANPGAFRPGSHDAAAYLWRRAFWFGDAKPAPYPKDSLINRDFAVRMKVLERIECAPEHDLEGFPGYWHAAFLEFHLRCPAGLSLSHGKNGGDPGDRDTASLLRPQSHRILSCLCPWK